MEKEEEQHMEELQEICREIFRTNYADETPFGKSVIRKAWRDRQGTVQQESKKEK